MIRSLLIDIFGSYQPVYYENSEQIQIIPDGMAGIDFPWVMGVVLFAITLYCVFRIVGGAFKK